MQNKKGFTLIEILLVIVIIAILAGIVLIAINPARQVSQANDAQRDSDVNALLNAIHQYSLDNRGIIPSEITASEGTISNAGVDICSYIVPTYIASIPVDPTDSSGEYTNCTDYYSGYVVSKDANNRLTVRAPSSEIASTISVTR